MGLDRDSSETAVLNEWKDQKTICKDLGISRSAFFRRLSKGNFEKLSVVDDTGGSRTLYRPTTGQPSPTSRTSPPPNQNQSETQAGPKRDLPGPKRDDETSSLERYQAQLHELVAAVQSAERDRADALAKAAAAETERDLLRDLNEQVREEKRAAELETRAMHEALDKQRKEADFERFVAERERMDKERAEAQLKELRQRLELVDELKRLSWWQFGRKRQTRALLAAVVIEG